MSSDGILRTPLYRSRENESKGPGNNRTHDGSELQEQNVGDLFLHWTVVFAPLVILPLVIFTLGLAWLFASLGVFLRDVGQTISIITMVMLFLSPIFYPASALPEEFRPWLYANPLTFIIEQGRAVLIWGQLPDWSGLGIYMLVATVVAWGGYAWFQKTRKGFADVL